MIIQSDYPFIKVNGILAAQTTRTAKVFTKFLLEEKFDLVIEIGTDRAGFSELIYSINKNLVSYDISNERNESNKPIDFRISNCFSGDTILDIKEEIDKHNKVLILCDGGDKETEVKLFSLFLKHGSYIMCHDYADNEEDYITNMRLTGWPSEAESRLENLSRSLNILEKSYNYKEFTEIFWDVL